MPCCIAVLYLQSFQVTDTKEVAKERGTKVVERVSDWRVSKITTRLYLDFLSAAEKFLESGLSLSKLKEGICCQYLLYSAIKVST